MRLMKVKVLRASVVISIFIATLSSFILMANADDFGKILQIISENEKEMQIKLSSDHRILTVDKSDQKLFEQIKEVQARGSSVLLETAEDGKILKVREVRKIDISTLILVAKRLLDLHHEVKSCSGNDGNNDNEKDVNFQKYEPSRLSKDDIKKYFDKFVDPSRSRLAMMRVSQCFKRAHVWSYGMFREDDVKSMKIFLFFGSRYMDEIGHKWWFHVAPMVLSSDNEELVLDYSFSEGVPQTVREWTDTFLKNKPECKVINDYSEYNESEKLYATLIEKGKRKKNEEEIAKIPYCFLRKVPMYYFQPADIEDADISRKAKEMKWSQGELYISKKDFPKERRAQIIIDPEKL